jgi:hypothetical protein
MEEEEEEEAEAVAANEMLQMRCCIKPCLAQAAV